MARIRALHPNVTTDPEFSQLSPYARLLGLYALTVADDAGNLEASTRFLRMSCFPGDSDLTEQGIEQLRDELIAMRYFVPYESDGKGYLHVRNFPKYQKPDHPTAPKFPLYPGQAYTYHIRQGNTFIPKTEKGPLPERSPNRHRTVPERSDAVLAEGIDLKDLKGKKGSGPDETVPEHDSPSTLEGVEASSQEQAGAKEIPLRDVVAQADLPQHVKDHLLGKDKGNGRGVVKVTSPKEQFIDTITDPVQRKALAGVITNDDMSGMDKKVHLKAAGFLPEQIGRFQVLFLDEGGQA